MVLDSHFHAVVLGNLHGFFELVDQRFNLRAVGFVAEHQAAADNAHHFGADGPGPRDMGEHIFIGSFVLTPLEPIRVAPGIDAVHFVVVELSFQLFEPAFIVGGEETGFQRDPVHV